MIYLQFFKSGYRPYDKPPEKEVPLPNIGINFGSKTISLKLHDYDIEGKAFDEYELRVNIIDNKTVDIEKTPITLMDGTSVISVEKGEAKEKTTRATLKEEAIDEYFENTINTEPFCDEFLFKNSLVKMVWKE